MDVLFQHVVVTICKQHSIPVVYDEVAVGMYRLGPSSTSAILQVTPDIAAYGKLLTGGYLPLAATLATEETFNSFYGSEKHRALLHGHSYTANPISCAAALEAVRQYRSLDTYSSETDNIAPSFIDADAIRMSKLPGVLSSVCLGSILTVDLMDDKQVSAEVMTKLPAVRVVEALRKKRVYARPLGNTIYVMTSQISTREATLLLLDALEECIRRLENSA